MPQLISCTSNILPTVVSILHRHHVGYDEMDSSDTNFPSLDLGANNQLLIVHVDMEQTVLDELSTVPEINIMEYPEDVDEKRAFRWKPLLFKVYAVAATLAAIYFGYFYMQDNFDKNYTYTWDTWGERQSSHYKKTGELESVAIDENHNFCFERIVQFAMNGRVSRQYVDANENGVFEIFQSNCDSHKTEEWYDRDEDMYFEEARIMLESGDTLRLIDRNRNGLYELEK